MELEPACEKRLLQINEIDEFWNDTYENAKIYKEQTKAWHDKHILMKELSPGQQMFLYDSRLSFFSR